MMSLYANQLCYFPYLQHSEGACSLWWQGNPQLQALAFDLMSVDFALPRLDLLLVLIVTKSEIKMATSKPLSTKPLLCLFLMRKICLLLTSEKLRLVSRKIFELICQYSLPLSFPIPPCMLKSKSELYMISRIHCIDNRHRVTCWLIDLL